VNGQLRAIETKPMMAAVWTNLNVVDGSLPTAISQLRQV
jgi:DNA-binding winged helix-turn-helix (wHTH) protein